MTTLLLFSGGFDSTAAFHLCLRKRRSFRALGFSYGQFHASAELGAAELISSRHSVPFEVLDLGGLGVPEPVPGVSSEGVSLANVPARNLIMLARAASHAASHFPGDESLELVIGCNRDDASRFPDCHADFFSAAEKAIRICCGFKFRDFAIWAPWAWLSKREVFETVRDWPRALEDLKDSVSCYRGSRCGSCDACTLRRSSSGL